MNLKERLRHKAGPGTRAFAVAQRVFTGVYQDGFIHAGNFAYMTILALFPFFIALAAIFSLIGDAGQRDASIDAVLTSVPNTVAKVIGPVAREVVTAREGWLLWVGGIFGLWTASSLVETIRDILHRAYGCVPHRAFWQYRLLSAGVIFVSVLLLLISLASQVFISTAQQVVVGVIPQLNGWFGQFVISQVVSGLVLFASMYLLFRSLTPSAYQSRRYPKWPGAALVAVWWLVVTLALPRVLSRFFSYDLTYGNLAGVMIALFFFWLVGLGMVVGAELNAALSVPLDEDDVSDA